MIMMDILSRHGIPCTIPLSVILRDAEKIEWFTCQYVASYAFLQKTPPRLTYVHSKAYKLELVGLKPAE